MVFDAPNEATQTGDAVVRILPENVANQIAAGEVVERPASVVKELVENALDAGATRIMIRIEGGGSRLVEVEDNGSGMTRANALVCLERQATSKISTSDDIVHIHTFGFRGEAIPSIASVSRFTLITRSQREDIATELHVVGGDLEYTGETGHPIGTTVSVRDLFFNVPVRRKFLRTATTELMRIRQTLTAIALAHPKVAFLLRVDDHDQIRLPENDVLDDRIRELLGESIAEALFSVDGQVEDIHISGYLSRPDFTRSGTPEQYIFVNRRPANAPQIQYAIREAWVNRETRPIVILFIDLPPEEVDVNVHPAKREIRFRHGNRVTSAIIEVLSKALAEQRALPLPSPTLSSSPAENLPPQEVKPPTFLNPYTFDTETRLPFPQVPIPKQTFFMDLPPPVDPIGVRIPAPDDALARTKGMGWKWLRVADILDPGYWLIVTDQGYLTVDAKAAVERILYERFDASTEEQLSQPLLLPETLHLPPADAERVRRFLPELTTCGFDLSPMGSDAFLINALPVVLSEIQPKELIASIATELERTGVKRGMAKWRREVVSRAAARAASEAFHIVAPSAVEQMMEQLAQCAMPYITPRGRPVAILTTYRELARRFQRG